MQPFAQCAASDTMGSGLPFAAIAHKKRASRREANVGTSDFSAVRSLTFPNAAFPCKRDTDFIAMQRMSPERSLKLFKSV